MPWRPRDALTPSQLKVLRLLLQLESAGRPPTYREIAAACGWRAPGTVRDHVRALTRLGMLTTSRQARSLRLTEGGRALVAGAEGCLGAVPVSGQGSDESLQEALAALRPYLQRRRFRGGAVLWREGDPAGLLVVLEQGRVKIFRTLARGRSVMLYALGPGEVFGFLPFLDGGPYPASAQAVEATEALVMSRTELLEALRDSPQLALPLFGFLGRRLREAFAQIMRLSTRSALPRVAGALAALLPEREAGAGLTIVSLPVRSGELAHTLGLTPESLSRAITELAARGILHRLGPRRLQVLDAAALRAAGRPGAL
jgi:CRP/FNR family transcriptional regulator